MRDRRYQKKATKLLEDMKTFLGVISDEKLVEFIRKELEITSLRGELESLEENKDLLK